VAVYDSAAIEFARSFYASIFGGSTLYKSFRDACRAAAALDASRGHVPQLLDTPGHPDPRQVTPLQHFGPRPDTDGPTASSSETEVSRSDIRALVKKNLKLDADLDAFALEQLPDVYDRWSIGMDRLSKVNMLLALHEPAEIAEALASFLKKAE
jgi:hypothetical protein